MKCTLRWLQQFVCTKDYTTAQLVDRLTMLGLEVDAAKELFAELTEITTARILAAEPHPDADKLTLCQVDTGAAIVQVVCGAPNARVGMLSALALPGVRLPDGNKIKKTKVRGVESLGMLCSARELGLSLDHSGILEVPEDGGPIACGVSLRKVLGLDDSVLEVDLTPNRADCASIRGIAREIAGFTGGPLQPLVAEVASFAGSQPNFQVHIEDAQLCPRYAARVVRQVRIGPSPWWMQQRLSAVGMRPINNIVDITNYVMLESGQPLHAFDYDTLAEQRIIVRLPKADEKEIVTLDGLRRTLDADTLLICDGKRPVALAGVMGGQETEITDATTTILLESACFNPLSIRRTARRLGIPSEASYRFERGVDPHLADQALQRAVNLLVELTGAVAENAGIDLYPGKKEALVIRLRVTKVQNLLGIRLEEEEIARLLSSIEFQVRRIENGLLEVCVPSFRVDIEREVDLIEEVARLKGYDNIPVAQPMIRMEYPARDPLRELRQHIASALTAQGFYEVINYSFVDPQHVDFCRLSAEDPLRQRVRLLNPLSAEQGVMRTLLLPGLLENVRRNLNFQQTALRLFETGKIFIPRAPQELPQEHMQLCMVMTGGRYPKAAPLHFADMQSQFVDMKGALVNLLHQLRRPIGVDSLACLPADEAPHAPAYLAPGAGLRLLDGERELGWLGRVHPETERHFDIKQPVYFCLLDVENLLHAQPQVKQFSALARYPSTRRDTSLVVREQTSAGALMEAIHQQKHKYIESVEIFDIYRGAPLQPGEKSVSLAVTYRSLTATLEDAAVDKIHEKIVRALMEQFNARYREGIEA